MVKAYRLSVSGTAVQVLNFEPDSRVRVTIKQVSGSGDVYAGDSSVETDPNLHGWPVTTSAEYRFVVSDQDELYLNSTSGTNVFYVLVESDW